MSVRAHRSGYTLVELLVSLGILSVILGILGAYFASQAQLSRRTQVRSDVQDRVRTVMQLVTQDLLMVGASHYINRDAAGVWEVTSANGFTPCTQSAPCIVAEDAGARDAVYVRYVTSLRDGQRCREVRYKFVGASLRRDDAECKTPPSETPLSTVPAESLAEDILAMDVRYYCSDAPPPSGMVRNSPTECGTTYPRSARVTVIGRSGTTVSPPPDPETLATIQGQAIQCPAGQICYLLEQEVQFPNLKPPPPT